MAPISDDALTVLTEQLARDRAKALGQVRFADIQSRNAEFDHWVQAGDNLAEKAVAAMGLGDEERVARLVNRLIALPVVDQGQRSGLIAVDMLVHNEVTDPLFDEDDPGDLIELPLRLLPTLDEPAADVLRRALSALTDYDIPVATERRIRAVVPDEHRIDEPFADVPEEDLPAAVLAVLRLVIRLRADPA